MCGSVDLMVLGGATPGEIVILFYVGTATGLVVGVLKPVLKPVRKLARRGAVNPGRTVRRLGRHWPGGVPGGMKPMLKPVRKPVFPNAYRPQAGFMNNASCKIPKTYYSQLRLSGSPLIAAPRAQKSGGDLVQGEGLSGV